MVMAILGCFAAAAGCGLAFVNKAGSYVMTGAFAWVWLSTLVCFGIWADLTDNKGVKQATANSKASYGAGFGLTVTSWVFSMFGLAASIAAVSNSSHLPAPSLDNPVHSYLGFGQVAAPELTVLL